MGFFFVLKSIAFGGALAADAFSVALANGFNEPKMRRARILGIAGMFALFQGIMPMIGWGCVTLIKDLFVGFEKWIPWIALVLLCFIGGKMLVEGILNCRKKEDTAEAEAPKSGFWALVVQGIATSIDALSVGFDIEQYVWYEALCSSLIIAAVTFGICVAGVVIGKKFGTRLAEKASIVGGAILVVIGVWIFIKGVFFC